MTTTVTRSCLAHGAIACELCAAEVALANAHFASADTSASYTVAADATALAAEPYRRAALDAAAVVLRHAFGPDASLRVETFNASDSPDSTRLFVVVTTHMNADAATSTLCSLIADWWIHRMPVSINVSVEFAE